MTPKTETLYKIDWTKIDPTMNAWVKVLMVEKYLEPVPAHVAGDLYRRTGHGTTVGSKQYFDYEKVTHVLPMTDGMSPKQISGTSSDDYEYVLLKECDKIREGDEIFSLEEETWRSLVFMNGEKIAKYVRPIRRRVSKSSLRSEILNALGETDESQIDIVKEVMALRDDSRKAFELQKNVEELEERLYGMTQSRDFYLSQWQLSDRNIGELKDTIESQNLTMEKRGKEFDELLESKAELRREIESQKREIERLQSAVEQYPSLYDRAVRAVHEQQDMEPLRKEIDSLKSELEEAKNSGVKWEYSDVQDKYIFQSDSNPKTLRVFWKGNQCVIPTPQPRTVEDEAFSDWVDYYFPECNADIEKLRKAFKAAKEAK